MSDAAPVMHKVRAIDAVPYHYGIWCAVGDDPKPFTNTIESVTWSDDGQHLWFMLGTHNFHKASPEEEIELVPLVPSEYCKKSGQEQHAKLLASRPVPMKACEHCGGRGKVPR